MDSWLFRVYYKGVLRDKDGGINASSSANYKLRCAFSPAIAGNFMEFAVRIASIF